MFVMLYVIHYFVSPLLVAHGFIPELLSNLLFMVAASYYHYLNFLGYDVLPFLERTTFFLYPIGVIIVLSPISKGYDAQIVRLVTALEAASMLECLMICVHVKKRRRNAAKNEIEEEKK
ncbi:hypothetical protein Gohar_003975, partial [Gossypium harknessii]|nr:hypothetical protein [Gossypium harknessii]